MSKPPPLDSDNLPPVPSSPPRVKNEPTALQQHQQQQQHNEASSKQEQQKNSIEELCVTAIQSNSTQIVVSKENAVEFCNSAAAKQNLYGSNTTDSLAISLADEYFLACSSSSCCCEQLQPNEEFAGMQREFACHICFPSSASSSSASSSSSSSSQAEEQHQLQAQDAVLQKKVLKSLTQGAIEILNMKNSSSNTIIGVTKRTFLDSIHGLVIQDWGRCHRAARRHCEALSCISRSGLATSPFQLTAPFCVVAEVSGRAFTATTLAPLQRQLRDAGATAEYRMLVEAAASELLGLAGHSADVDSALSGCRFAWGADGRIYCHCAVGIFFGDDDDEEEEDHAAPKLSSSRLASSLLFSYDGPIVPDDPERQQDLFDQKRDAAFGKVVDGLMRIKTHGIDVSPSDLLIENGLDSEHDLPLLFKRLAEKKNKKSSGAAVDGDFLLRRRALTDMVVHVLHIVVREYCFDAAPPPPPAQDEEIIQGYLVKMCVFVNQLLSSLLGPESSYSEQQLPLVKATVRFFFSSISESVDESTFPKAVVPSFEKVSELLAERLGMTKKGGLLVFAHHHHHHGPGGDKKFLSRITTATCLFPPQQWFTDCTNGAPKQALQILSARTENIMNSESESVAGSFPFFCALKQAHAVFHAQGLGVRGVPDAGDFLQQNVAALTPEFGAAESDDDVSNSSSSSSNNSFFLVKALYRNIVSFTAAMQKLSVAASRISSITATTTPARTSLVVNLPPENSITEDIDPNMSMTVAAASASANNSPTRQQPQHLSSEQFETASAAVTSMREAMDAAVPAVEHFLKESDALISQLLLEKGRSVDAYNTLAQSKEANGPPAMAARTGNAAILSSLLLQQVHLLCDSAPTLGGCETLRPHFSAALKRLDLLTNDFLLLDPAAVCGSAYAPLIGAAIDFFLTPLTPNAERSEALPFSKRKEKLAAAISGTGSAPHASAVYDTAHLLFRLCDFAAARSSFEQAFKMLRDKAPGSALACECANSLALVLFKLAHQKMDTSDKRTRLTALKFVFPPAVDSLLKESASTLQYVIVCCSNDNQDSAAAAASSAAEFSALLAECYSTTGAIAVYRGKYHKALTFFDEGLKLAAQGGFLGSKKMALLRNNKSMCERRLQASAAIRIACMWRRLQARRRFRKLKEESEEKKRARAEELAKATKAAENASAAAETENNNNINADEEE